MADENDDLLDPAEIEALLNSAGSGGSAPTEEPSSQDDAPNAENSAEKPVADVGGVSDSAGDSQNELLEASDIEALLQQRDSGAPMPSVSAPPASPTEKLIDQAEANLARAVSPEMDSPSSRLSGANDPTPFAFQQFDLPGESSEQGLKLQALQDVELDLRIELGRAELLIEDVLKLRAGSVVPLDKLAGDPVDILVNGRLIARGEVLVLNDNFCVRVAEILTPDF